MAFFDEDDVINWLATSDRDTRLDFLKKVASVLKYEELKPAMHIIDNAKKRKSPNKEYANKIKREKRAAKNRDVPEQCSSASTDTAPKSSLLAQKPVEVAAPNWWMEIGIDNIVAIDCEMVSLHKKNQFNKHIVEAATVGIVDWNGNKTEFKVKHLPGTFIVNDHTVRITGIGKNDLNDGTPFSEVKLMVKELLEDKLVVVCNGAADFRSLSLEISEFDVFDIHSVFRKWNGTFNKLGNKTMQPIGLAKLIRHYFQQEVHDGPHDALADASYTMKLFKEVYTSLAMNKNPFSRLYDLDDNEFINIV